MRSGDNLFDETPLPSGRQARRAGKREPVREPVRERSEGSLAGAAKPFLEAALLLNRGASFNPSFSEYRRTVLAARDEFRVQARRIRVPEEDVEAAEYALVAFVDEMVAISSWSGADQWRREPLEMKLFNRTEAGDEFFKRIDALRDSHHQALEVYYLCLILGFEGGLRSEDPQKREDLSSKIDSLRRRLGVAAQNWEKRIFEPAYQRLRPTERAQRMIGRMWLVAGWSALGAVLIFYLVYWLLLLQAAGRSASILSRG